MKQQKLFYPMQSWLSPKIYTFVTKTLLTLREFLYRLFVSSDQKRLAKLKRTQRANFDLLVKQFPIFYENLKNEKIDIFVTSLWRKYNQNLEKIFLPYPSFSFLRNPIIMYTMFATAGGEGLKKELAYIEKKIPKDKLKKLLEEDYVGDPLILSQKYLTSHNSIDHAYHIARFEEATGCDIAKVQRVVEWGGGYGNMAKIFKRINPGVTYVVVDTPLFNCLGWLYLSTIFGQEEVHFIQNETDRIIPGRINILPLCFLAGQKITTDLFLSTWALCESSKYSQQLVARKHWFGAPHLFLSYQKNDERLPDAENVGILAKKLNAKIVPVGLLPDNYYAFN